MADSTLDKVMEKYQKNKPLNEEESTFLIEEFNKAVQGTDYELIVKLDEILGFNYEEHDAIGRIVNDAIAMVGEEQQQKDKKTSSIEKLIENEQEESKTIHKQPKKTPSRGENANYFIDNLSDLINLSNKITKSRIEYSNLKNDIEQAREYGANIRFYYTALALKTSHSKELETENFRKGEREKDFVVAAYALGFTEPKLCIKEKAKIMRTIFKDTKGHLKFDKIKNPTDKDKLNAGYQFKAIVTSYLKNNKESLNSGSISFSREIKEFDLDEMIVKYS